MKERRRALLLVVAVFLMVLAYAFAASNTVPDSRAGDGQGNISGYTVSNVHYELNSADPGRIDKVQFNLDSAAGTVYAAVSQDALTWVWSDACTGSGGTWVCDFPTDPEVQPQLYLRVVAAE